jgi:hypothetical protein
MLNDGAKRGGNRRSKPARELRPLPSQILGDVLVAGDRHRDEEATAPVCNGPPWQHDANHPNVGAPFSEH